MMPIVIKDRFRDLGQMAQFIASKLMCANTRSHSIFTASLVESLSERVDELERQLHELLRDD